MELSILEALAGYGVGGILAVIIFFMYRKDRKTSENRLREDRKFMEERLTKIIHEDQNTRKENTVAVTELVTLIKRLNGKLK